VARQQRAGRAGHDCGDHFCKLACADLPIKAYPTDAAALAVATAADRAAQSDEREHRGLGNDDVAILERHSLADEEAAEVVGKGGEGEGEGEDGEIHPADDVREHARQHDAAGL
jgi:hypothetical protein